jgi:hypothetical protein
MAGSGYTQGVARVREERPPRACVADAAERR